MPLNTDAQVVVGITGDDAIVRAAAKVGEAWRASGQAIASSAKSMGGHLSDAFQSAAKDAISVATSASRISFSAGAASAKLYGIEVARMAVSSGRDIQGLKDQFASLAREKMIPEQEIAALASGLRSVTYDAKFATDSIGGIADEALAIGEAPQQVAGFAASLHNVYGVSQNVAKSMEDIDEISNRVGNTGGPRALHDQMVAADGIMSRFKGNAKETAALLATLGKGYTAGQQASTQQSVLGAITGNRIGVEHLLRGTGQLGRGQSILNAHGEIEDQIGTTEKVRAGLVKRYGAKRALQVARMTFGDVEGSALMEFDAKAARAEAARATPDRFAAQATASKVRSTTEAQQIETDRIAAENERKMGGALGSATAGVNRFIADHPVLGFAVQPAVSAVEGWAKENPGKAAAIAAVGSAAVAGTRYVDEKWVGASDFLSGTGKHSDIKRSDDSAWIADRSSKELLGGAADELISRRQGKGAPGGAADVAHQAEIMAKALSQIQLNATVQQLPDGTVKGVKLGKASAARQ